MNEDLRRCLESIQNAMEELKAIRDDLMISDLYAAQKAYGLSDEVMKIVFAL